MSTIKEFIKPNKFSKIALIIFAILLITSTFLQSSVSAQAPDCLSTTVTRVDADYNGPVFLDAYWTDRSASSTDVLNPTELEVGPGEGPSTLAVVFVNRSPLELYAITGYLRLPEELKPGGTSADPEAKAYFGNTISKRVQDVTQATYFDKLAEGEVFTLYFDINITDQAKVGSYLGQVILDYSTPDHVRSCKSALLDVPFIIPGKVILDLTTDNKPLTPKTSNAVDFIISNKGSSDANDVIVSILNIGDTNSRSSGSGSSVTLSSAETQLVNLGANTFNVGTIPANGTTRVTTEIFPEATSGSTVQNVSVQIDYGNGYGYKLTQSLTTGLVVAPKPSDSPIIVTVDTPHEQSVITAGTVENIKFQVTNSGKDDITDLLVTLSGESTDMKILGKSKWIVDSLPVGETIEISTDVFGSTSLINAPSSFNLNLDYISDGESHVDTSNVGVFVAGKIDLKLYDLTVNDIGGSLYLVGSILNQGSTTGKFADIELVSYPKISQQTNSTHTTQGTNFSRPDETKTASISPQYIGDLTEDSSIPFSIPLPYPTLPPGEYPFSFKVNYADDLRDYHEVVFDESVKVSQIQHMQPNGRQNQSNFGFLGFLTPEIILIIIVAAIGISIAAAFIKKARSKTLPKDELDFLLEDKSGRRIES